MLSLPFKLHFAASLAHELSRGFRSISVEPFFDNPRSRQELNRYAKSIRLWREDGTGIKIESRMHDVRERFEVGVLEFWQVAAAESHRMETIGLPDAFWHTNRAFKLVLSDDAVTAESGISIEGDSAEIVLAAGANPYTLSILLPGNAHYHQPEFELSHYKRIPLISE